MDWEHRYVLQLLDLVKRKFILTHIFFYFTSVSITPLFLPFCLGYWQGSIATAAMPSEASI